MSEITFKDAEEATAWLRERSSYMSQVNRMNKASLASLCQIGGTLNAIGDLMHWSKFDLAQTALGHKYPLEGVTLANHVRAQASGVQCSDACPHCSRSDSGEPAEATCCHCQQPIGVNNATGEWVNRFGYRTGLGCDGHEPCSDACPHHEVDLPPKWSRPAAEFPYHEIGFPGHSVVTREPTGWLCGRPACHKPVKLDHHGEWMHASPEDGKNCKPVEHVIPAISEVVTREPMSEYERHYGVKPASDSGVIAAQAAADAKLVAADVVSREPMGIAEVAHLTLHDLASPCTACGGTTRHQWGEAESLNIALAGIADHASDAIAKILGA